MKISDAVKLARGERCLWCKLIKIDTNKDHMCKECQDEYTYLANSLKYYKEAQKDVMSM